MNEWENWKRCILRQIFYHFQEKEYQHMLYHLSNMALRSKNYTNNSKQRAEWMKNKQTKTKSNKTRKRNKHQTATHELCVANERKEIQGKDLVSLIDHNSKKIRFIKMKTRYTLSPQSKSSNYQNVKQAKGRQRIKS